MTLENEKKRQQSGYYDVISGHMEALLDAGGSGEHTEISPEEWRGLR